MPSSSLVRLLCPPRLTPLPQGRSARKDHLSHRVRGLTILVRSAVDMVISATRHPPVSKKARVNACLDPIEDDEFSNEEKEVHNMDLAMSTLTEP